MNNDIKKTKIEELNDYKKNKLALFSTIDKSFYDDEYFYQLIKYSYQLTYANLLSLSQKEFDCIKTENYNSLKEVHILFLYLKQFNSLNEIKEIYFYEAPDFLIIMKDNSIIGLEVTDISPEGSFDFDKLPYNQELILQKNELPIRAKCYTYSSDRLIDVDLLNNNDKFGRIEKIIYNHILKKTNYIDNIKNKYMDNQKIKIHYFFYDKSFEEEFEKKQFSIIYNKHKNEFKKFSINPEKDFYFNELKWDEQS